MTVSVMNLEWMVIKPTDTQPVYPLVNLSVNNERMKVFDGHKITHFHSSDMKRVIPSSLFYESAPVLRDKDMLSVAINRPEISIIG